MFIVPIGSNIRPVESLFDNESFAKPTEDGAKFSGVFKEILSDVMETQKVVQEDNIKMIMGEIDDLHTIYNNATKAAIAVEAFVAVKNAAMDSYDRILQMQM